MFGWIKRLVLKSIIKDVTKKLPEYKGLALFYIDEHKDEVLEKVKKAITDVIKIELDKVYKK